MSRQHSKLKQDGQRALREQGWLVVPQTAGPETGPGVHDTIVCAGGRFFTVEWKTYEDPMNDSRYGQQLLFARRVERAGGVAVIPCYSPEDAVSKIRAKL